MHRPTVQPGGAAEMDYVAPVQQTCLHMACLQMRLAAGSASVAPIGFETQSARTLLSEAAYHAPKTEHSVPY